jgi:predicted dinucleotide-binding enzyme
MKIGIAGTGAMALYLARGWLAAGHAIRLGSRQPEARQGLLRAVPGATLAAVGETVEAAEILVIAIPYTAVAPFAQEHAPQLRNKLVVDVSNPFEHLPDNRISGPELTARAIGPGARVVAAFKANFWETLLEPVSAEDGIVRDVFYAGDDAAGKEIVAGLIADLGFRPVDCGPLRSARILDGMVPLLLELDQRYAGGAHRLSWKLLA